MKEKNTNILYKKLIEHMNEAVWMGDKDENTIYANPKFVDMLGYSLDEMIGKKSYIFWDEESAQRVKNVNVNKRKKGVNSSYEGNLVTKQGKKIPVLLSGTPLEDGGTIGIMTDLSALKEKEENEAILLNAVKYSTDAMIMFNHAGKIISWNKGAKIMFGYSSDNIIGKKIATIFDKKDIDVLLQESEIIYKHELIGVHKNKNELNVSTTITPIVNQKSKTKKSYLVICRDMTNHRKIEEEIELKYYKIREVYEKIGILKRQNDYIFDLLEIFENYYHDIKSMGDFIVTSIIMLTQIDGCVFRIYNKKNNTLEMISNFGLANNWEGKKIIKYKKSLAEKAMKSNSMLKILDISHEPLYQSPALARRSNVSSMLLIPLKCRGEIIGSISLYTQPDRKLKIFENEFIEKYTKIIELVVASTV